MAWGKLELIYSLTNIRISANNARKKEKERKRLTRDKVKYRMRNQFAVCGTPAWARFVLLLHADLFVQRGCAKQTRLN